MVKDFFIFLKKAINKLSQFYHRFFSMFYFKKQMKKNPDACLAFIPECGIGDFIISIAYLKSFKEQANKKIILYIGDSKSLRYLINFYQSYDEVKYLKIKKMKKISKAGICMKKWSWYEKYHNKRKMIIISPWPYVNEGLLYFKKLNCLDLFADTVFRFVDTYEIDYPKLKFKTFTDNKKVLFNISSYSSKISNDLFFPIVEYFQSLGYEIYTNCINENSFCLPNTKPYIASINDLIENIKQFEYIISVRSGILDLLASSKVKQIVIYENHRFINLYSLKMWKCMDVLEMLPTEPKMMEKIKTFVNNNSTIEYN